MHKYPDWSYTINQSVYITQKLKEFEKWIPIGGRSSPLPSDYQKILADEAENGKEISNNFPYRKVIGSLMYAMLGSRPDLAAAISILSQFLEKPKACHVDLLVHVLQYRKVNPNLGITYDSKSEIVLEGYVDGGDLKFKSRSGFGFKFVGGLISWYSGKQSITAQSSAEAEYYAAVTAANEAVWFRQLLEDLGQPQKTITLYEDNQACISLTKNPEDHKRTKHIQIKYHVVRDYVKEKLVQFTYCKTQDQLADIFTKGVPGSKLRSMTQKLGMSRIDIKSQGES